MLDTIRLMFANLDASLIHGAHFEKAPDGADVPVTPEDIVFIPEANSHPRQGGSGQVNPAVALATLKRNSFIDVERADGGIRMRLGVRGKGDP
jgi:hypothetical protein